MKRPRTKLAMPKVPGGFFDFPPEGCPHIQKYCPDEKRYEPLFVVNYINCDKCKFTRSCERKVEEDRSRRKRIALQRNGE